MSSTTINKLIAYLTILSGLSISAVAIYYSVAGLTAIFAAAVVPIIIMGVALEISKLVATVWLKQNWSIAPLTIKIYLIIAILMLMLITSVGIFGFLSSAHANQTLVSGDVQAKIAVYDAKIAIEKENIETSRKALDQMNKAVDEVLARSTSEQGARRASNLRRSQRSERQFLLTEIEESQKIISQLTEERAPIAASLRQVEAEVGPIKYIAKFVYGETNVDLLEKAVTWVIILLIVVFDPLAVVLLLAGQHSLLMMKQKESTQETQTSQPSIEKPNNIDTLELWNALIKSAEGGKPIDLPTKPYEWKTTIYPPKQKEIDLTESPKADSVDLTADHEDVYVQNEEQKQGGRWKDLSKVISEKEYLETTEKNIQDMIQRVRSGILPFYKVPEDYKEQVKKGLDNERKNNSNNTP
jgi:hypothetical protein